METWPLGPVLVMEALWERFGIAGELRRIERESKCTVPYERALRDDGEPTERADVEVRGVGPVARQGAHAVVRGTEARTRD